MKSHRRTRAERMWVAVPGKKAAGPLSPQGAETPAWGSGDRPCNEGAHDLSGGLGPSGERALSLTVSLRLCRRQPSGAGVTVPPRHAAPAGDAGCPGRPHVPSSLVGVTRGAEWVCDARPQAPRVTCVRRGRQEFMAQDPGRQSDDTRGLRRRGRGVSMRAWPGHGLALERWFWS